MGATTCVSGSCWLQASLCILDPLLIFVAAAPSPLSESFSDDEKEAMMDSIRQVTRNTMFDQWLGAVKGAGGGGGGGGGDASGRADDSSTAAASARPGVDKDSVDLRPLTEVAEYLASASGAGGAGGAEGMDGRGGGGSMGGLQCGHRLTPPHPQQQVWGIEIWGVEGGDVQGEGKLRNASLTWRLLVL